MRKIVLVCLLALVLPACGGERAPDPCETLVSFSDWGAVTRLQSVGGETIRLKLRFDGETWQSLEMDLSSGPYRCSRGTIETEADRRMRPFASVCQVDVGPVVNWGGRIYVPQTRDDLSDLTLFDEPRLRGLCPQP